MQVDNSFDVAVVGGGAAGLMAALFAARGGAKTCLLEGSRACGLKILISGGGRCNILPSQQDNSDFFTQGSRNVLKRLFKTWTRDQIHEFLECDLKIPLVVEEDTGKLFPESQSARLVRDRFVESCESAGAHLKILWRVTEILRSAKGSFELTSSSGEKLFAQRIVLATGGCSVPKTGSDGAGYEFAKRWGHSVLPLYPALVPLTTADQDFQDLSGISLPVTWRVTGPKNRILEERTRELLFTHRGFSGPATLDASHWSARDGLAIEISWGALTKEEWEDHWQSRGRRELARALGDKLPRRLAELLIYRAQMRLDTRIGNLTRSHREKLLRILCNFQLPVQGNEGFRVAEVTGGGIPLNEVNPSTLESRIVPDLFFCGEIMDVIGRIGGFNFQWAWVTGKLAGESAARRMHEIA